MSFKPSEVIKNKRQPSTFNYKRHLQDRIGADTYNTDIEQFNKDYGSDYLSNWHSADEINAYYDRLTDLNDRTKAYQTFVSNYGTDEQKSALENIGKQVSAYDEIIGARQDVLDYYGGFNSADEFKTAFEQYAEQQAADEEFFNTYDIEGAKVKLDKLEKQHKSPIQDPFGYIGDLGAYYGELDAEIRSLENDISRWEDIYNTKKYSQYTKTADYNPQYAKSSDLYDLVTRSQKSTAMEQEAYGRYKQYADLSDKELGKFYALYDERGEDAAKAYLEYLSPTLQARREKNAAKFAKDHPFWASVQSAIMDITSVPVEQINSYIDYGFTGKLDYNDAARQVEIMQGAVAEEMGEFGSFLYGTATSGGTSLGAALASKGAGGILGEVLLGLSAAAHTQNDILARGGNSNQAALGGIAAGAFEALFEHMSISKLVNLDITDWIPSLKNVLREVAISAGINATEEMFTEIANIAFDMVNMGELSNAVLQYKELIDSGEEKSTAFWKTLGKNIAQVVEAGASGALMGLGFGAIEGGAKLSKVDKARRNLGGVAIKNGKLETLLPEMEEYYKGEGHAEEQKLLKKIKEGIGKESTSIPMKRAAGKLIERYSEAKYKEKNKKVAEQSAENLNKTRENATQEANKVKVDTVSPDINYDNMPKILGFEGANLDKTIIETADGAAALTDMSISNADIASIYSYAVRLGNAESANAFIENWDQQSEPFQYYLDFLKFQTRGLYAPESYDNTMSDYADVKISPMAKHAAFKSGISLRESAREKSIKQSEALKEEYKKLGGKAIKGKFNDSKLNYSTLTQQQKDVVNFTRILSDYLGVNVEYFVSQKGRRGANGYYRQSNNTIYLDINAGIEKNEVYSVLQDCLVNTISHEVVHNMKVTAPAEYNALRDFIIDRLSKQEGYDLDARIEQIVLENSKQGFTAEDAIEEIVAMSCEDLLGSSAKLQEAMSEFYEQNEKAANSFTKFVREVLARLKAFFETIINKKSGTAESMLMAKQSAEFISELQKRYDAALLAMREGNAVRNTQNTTEGEKVMKQARALQKKDPTKLKEDDLINLIQYSKSKLFTDGSYIPVRVNTPQILIAFAKEMGYTLENFPMAMSVYKVRQAVSDIEEWDGDPKDTPHDLEPTQIVEIIRAMNNPSYLVFQTKNERFSEIVKFDNGKEKAYAIIDFFDVNKNAEIMNGYQGGKYNILITVYPSEDTQGLKDYLKDNRNKVKTGEEMKKKGLSQRGLGSYVPAHLNDSPFFKDIITEENPNVNPSDEKTFNQTRRDTDYLDAVNRGDMETAQRMVDEAANIAMPDSKIRTEDGRLRVVYHGTNTGNFTVFNPDYIGMSSGDDGFFGMGFYFAYSKGEASYYGAKRIIPAYLDLKNPFNFDRELQTYKGQKASSGYAPDAVALMNFADKFPEIAKNVTIDIVEHGSEDVKSIPISEFGKAFKNVISNKKFEYSEVSNEFGEKETVVTADEKTVEYEYNGQKYSYKDYGFQKRFWGTPNDLDVAYEYLANAVYESVYMVKRTNLILDNNREFTAALKSMGYDGAIQSEYGDEAVAFEPSQIKSADPVTYDDNGNVIPLSERFNAENEDIRYQKRADNSHSQAALEQFGTTSDFEQTGFVLEDGRMLKLSQYGLKGVNHQRIAQVYDDAKGSEAVNRFIQEGNVRIKATSPGIEIGTETPITVSQLNTISRFISNSLKTRGIFYLDITDANGNEVATKTYYEDSSAEEVKYDIEDYYNKGTIPREKYYFQKRNSDLSPNRKLLASALESTIDTTTEEGQEQLKRLKEYKNSIKRIKTLEKQRADLVDKGMELMRKKGKSAEENAELKSIWEQTKSLEKKISLHDKELLRLEALKPIQRLLYREKAKAEKEAKKQGLEKQKEIRENYTRKEIEERAKAKEKQKEIRENYTRKEYIRKIEERAKGLTNAVKNVGDKHVPAPLREAIGNLVLSLDFSSKSKLAGKGETKKDIKFSEAFIELAKIIEHRTPNTANGESSALEEFFVDCDITDEFRQQFTEIKDKVDKIARQYGSEKEALVLRTLSSEQLRQINSALYKLAEQIGKANKLMANNLFKNVTEMSDEFIEYAEKFVQKQDVKWLEKLIDVENLLPYYAFKRMGEVGLSIFNEWADGMDKYAKVAKEIVDFTQDLYTAKEIKDWNNAVHEIEIKGKKLYFTTAHLMSFYCLWKREAAKSHISGYGIRVETFDVDKTTKKPLGKTYTNPTNGVHITDEAAQLLLDELNKDKRAKEVADALQKFMSTRCAELANEITMKRFGEKAYTEEFYFPMEVNENEKPADGDITAESLYALVNKSFTKQLVPKSTSSLTIRNIFDVFAAHTTDVAAYHSLAMPLLDTLKFYNYKQKGSDAVGDPDAKTVRGQIEHAFGKPFLGYLKNFIKDTTGTSITSDRGSDAVGKWVSRYKIAAVAANLRVIVLQPTSYLRVSAVMKHRYLLKEIKDIPQLNKAVERMNKYSGVALWKNELGFRDVNISRSLADKIKHADTIGDKVTDIAMKGAELADKITWANIWLACEEEIKATDKSVSVGSEAFYNKVSKRFREVIYSTQVVDSPLAKSNMARSKSFWNRTVTSFMSEPVVSHNLLLDSYHELADTKRRGEKITWGNVRRVGRLVLAYAINATAQSVVESLIDALRATADDDDEEFVEAYTSEFISNFLRELDPLSKIPIFKDVIDVIRATFSGGYYSGQDMQTAVFDRVAKAIKETMKYYSGESSTTKFIKRVLDALSSLTGIPIGNTYREIKTIWNNTMEMFNDGSGRIE